MTTLIEKILKKGGIGVLPTDTIYGLVGSALSRKTVERIYKVKKRKQDKPFIILISSLKDLKLFNIRPDKEILILLRKIFPAKVSIILPCKNKKFFYLHRNKNSLAFRIPKDIWLRRLLSKTGPLVAPSANLEGMPPAEIIEEAKEYFGDKIDFYFNKGRKKEKPSIILEIKRLT
ncbi:threonylcarbamoyl-AMP synthase [Candidatus Parcubacteria bacterium]|nr:threonylcarbamoyl-AMP synthase [Candidatus Parcubacteria bacterium]